MSTPQTSTNRGYGNKYRICLVDSDEPLEAVYLGARNPLKCNPRHMFFRFSAGVLFAYESNNALVESARVGIDCPGKNYILVKPFHISQEDPTRQLILDKLKRLADNPN